MTTQQDADAYLHRAIMEANNKNATNSAFIALTLQIKALKETIERQK